MIVEELDPSFAHLGSFLKRWADTYPFTAECKGSVIRCRPEMIIVTSNYHPRDIWSDPAMLEPILRRFKCVEFKKLGDNWAGGVPCQNTEASTSTNTVSQFED
eukprot:6212704-Pleurochrysis_carterae.AAC.2